MQCFGSGFLPANHQGSIFLSGDPALKQHLLPRENGSHPKKKLEFLHDGRRVRSPTIARRSYRVSDYELRTSVPNAKGGA